MDKEVKSGINALDKEVKKDIFDYKIKNIEEYFYMYLEFIEAYFKSLYKFGINSIVTQDASNAIDEFINIQGMEVSYLNFIRKHLKTIDGAQALEFIDIMDEFKENVLEYYTTVFEDISTAAEINRPFSAMRTKNKGKFITDDDSLEKDIVSSSYTYEDIINFVDPNLMYVLKDHVEFYDYRLEDNIDNAKLDFDPSILPIDRNFKLYLPLIVNYESLITNFNIICQTSHFLKYGDLSNYVGSEESEMEFVLRRI